MGPIEGVEIYGEKRKSQIWETKKMFIKKKQQNSYLKKEKKRKPTIICSLETGFAVAGMFIHWGFPSSFPCGAF